MTLCAFDTDSLKGRHWKKEKQTAYNIRVYLRVPATTICKHLMDSSST